jgi:hypothetical protein
MPLVTFDVELGDRADELCKYLVDKFENCVRARANQVDDKYRRWQDNYSAKPLESERTTPFVGASNFVPQLIRMHTDIFSARMCGIFFATKPFWSPKTLLGNAIPHECLEALSTWMEHKSLTEMEIFEPVDQAIFQTAKTGTAITKTCWLSKEYSLKMAERSTGQPKIEQVTIDGCQLYNVAFEDFWPWPLTARSLKEVVVKFHRIRLTKDEVEYRATKKIWEAKACKALVEQPEPTNIDTKREAEAAESGIELTADVARPFTAIEAWFDYPLANDGTFSRLIVTFNPKQPSKEGILRAIHNYYPPKVDPFADFRMMPRDDLFYGYSIPEILEQSQEEQAQIHNARRDGNIIANVPTFKKRMYGNVPNPSSSWYPGKVFELENMDDLDVFQFGQNYNSMIEEESFLLQMAERYTGIQPPMQGFGAGAMEGKRGIYNSGGTLALLAEGNKRLDIFLRRVRFPFHRIGNCIAYSYRQFRDEWPEIELMGESGVKLKELLNAKDPKGITNLLYDISASDAGTNRELDRQNLLLMANTMAAYYRQVTEASTFMAQLPPDSPLAPLLMSVLNGARDLANRLLFVFDIGDRDRLLPDVQELLTGGRGGAANIPGMPESEGPLERDQLQGISTYLTALASGGTEEAGGGGRPQ